MMTDDTRRKRLRMRSWRRGTKEMDLILGPFADARLAGLEAAALDAYEALLDEADSDLYAWILARSTGAQPPAPAHLQAILEAVTRDALARLRVDG